MGKRQKGYTIIEVMLFLAISGALFSMTVFTMRGQQETQMFKQSMEDMEFRIRSTLSDVDRGYAAKPDDTKNYNCSGGAPTVSLTGDAQCVFVGKEINMCADAMYISTRVAPFVNNNYIDTDSVINTNYESNRDNFDAPGGIKNLSSGGGVSGGGTPCRIAAMNTTIGTSNQRTPRFSAKTTETSWTPIADSAPAVICFRQSATSGKYATITVSQSDVVLEIGVAPCGS